MERNHLKLTHCRNIPGRFQHGLESVRASRLASECNESRRAREQGGWRVVSMQKNRVDFKRFPFLVTFLPQLVLSVFRLITTDRVFTKKVPQGFFAMESKGSQCLNHQNNSNEIKSRLLLGLLENLSFSICVEAESHMSRQSWLWSGDAAFYDHFYRNDMRLKTACWTSRLEHLTRQSFHHMFMRIGISNHWNFKNSMSSWYPFAKASFWVFSQHCSSIRSEDMTIYINILMRADALFPNLANMDFWPVNFKVAYLLNE